jgi:hypothetical protein
VNQIEAYSRVSLHRGGGDGGGFAVRLLPRFGSLHNGGGSGRSGDERSANRSTHLDIGDEEIEAALEAAARITVEAFEHRR